MSNMPFVVRVTPKQSAEAAGLLDVCDDDFRNGDRDDSGWGVVRGGYLDIINPEEAITDLRDRAKYLREEGYAADQAAEGAALARSLDMLADKIKEAASAAPDPA